MKMGKGVIVRHPLDFYVSDGAWATGSAPQTAFVCSTVGLYNNDQNGRPFDFYGYWYEATAGANSICWVSEGPFGTVIGPPSPMDINSPIPSGLVMADTSITAAGPFPTPLFRFDNESPSNPIMWSFPFYRLRAGYQLNFTEISGEATVNVSMVYLPVS